MSDIARYCEFCGKPLSTNARFCGRCGNAVSVQAAPVPSYQPAAQQPPPPPAASRQVYSPPQPAYAPPVAYPVQPIQPAEVVLGVIPGALRKKGFLGMGADAFTIVVTNARLIFAYLGADTQKENLRKAKEDAKAAGKGFFGQWGAMMGANFGSQYLCMPPQQILQENHQNFFYLLQQIQKVRIIHHDNSDDGGSNYHSIEFHTSSGKFKFDFSMFNERETKNLLRQVLGEIVR